MNPEKFQTTILNWWKTNGRHDLPWRKTHDPYRILISEVMLQQTQVSRVIPKYREFLRAFPTIHALNRARLDQVLIEWRGLGYNRRSVQLKRLAARIVKDNGGRIPNDVEVLESLPGVGPGTAGAIATFAFGKRVAFIETNIRRVYLHFFFKNRQRVDDKEILKKIFATLPTRTREWYYGIMDYGALALKAIPNPNRKSKHYVRQVKFAGSRRELRGQIVKNLVEKGSIVRREFNHIFNWTIQEAQSKRGHIDEILRDLEKDGLVKIKGNIISLAK